MPGYGKKMLSFNEPFFVVGKVLPDLLRLDLVSLSEHLSSEDRDVLVCEGREGMNAGGGNYFSL